MLRVDISCLENIKDDMRPWVYQLVNTCLTKANDDEDEHAITAFLSICDKQVLWTKTDVELFDSVRSLLEDSEHRDYYVNLIHNTFREIHGDVEGM